MGAPQHMQVNDLASCNAASRPACLGIAAPAAAAFVATLTHFNEPTLGRQAR